MKYITVDELYNWMPCSSKELADAQIPDELHTRLDDAIAHYLNVCKIIDQYLKSYEGNAF